MHVQFESVPNSSVIAQEIGRYPDVTTNLDVLLNEGRYHFKLLGPSGRHEVLGLSQEMVGDLGGKNNEHRISQLKLKVRETVRMLAGGPGPFTLS